MLEMEGTTNQLEVHDQAILSHARAIFDNLWFFPRKCKKPYLLLSTATKSGVENGV